MSYRTVKNGIVTLLGKAALTESTEAFNFDDASANEYGNTFIVIAESGTNNNEVSSTASDRVYDEQVWSIAVAYKKTAFSDIIDRDVMLVKKDELISILDKPANNTFCKLLKYQDWEVDEVGDYFLLTLRLKIIDQIVYA